MMHKLLIKPSSKVAIVGAGMVGSTSAYTLMLDGIVSEIALIDSDSKKASGHALDLQHGMQFTRTTTIVAGDSFELVRDACVVIIAAGLPQKVGQSRLDLLEANSALFKEIIPKIVHYNKDCILLIVTNPLDVLTHLAWKLSGFSSCKVFGTGTVLDTARLRYFLGSKLDVSPKDITAFVLGEHGDSEFIWWSKANVAGIPLSSFSQFSPQLMEEVSAKIKNAAYEVIEKKGATYYAIGLVIAKIVRSILLQQQRVFTVSNIIHNVDGLYDVAMSVPTIINDNGICSRLPLDLEKEELTQFTASALKIDKAIKSAL